MGRKVFRPSILIWCEGLLERMFIEHLNKIYSYYVEGVSIQYGGGGAPDKLVKGAIKKSVRFEKTFVVLDADRKEIVQAREMAQENGVILVESDPCMEHTLLSVLHPDEDFSSDKGSGWYKKEFMKRHISREDKRYPDSYKKVFPKSKLDERRKHVSKLDAMISLVEEGGAKRGAR